VPLLTFLGLCLAVYAALLPAMLADGRRWAVEVAALNYLVLLLAPVQFPLALALWIVCWLLAFPRD